MIQFTNVNKTYRENLYNDLSFTINKGEFIGLSGASGSGKTTILRMISGLEKPTSGIINNTFSKVGYIFQDFHLYPHLSVIDNICIASKSNKESKAEYLLRAESLMKNYTIDALRDRFPNELSGGEKQRVAIVRCLMQQPELILVDEATSALDSVNTYSFMNQLLDLNSQGKTIIFITHNSNILNSFAKRVIKIEKAS